MASKTNRKDLNKPNSNDDDDDDDDDYADDGVGHGGDGDAVFFSNARRYCARESVA